MMRFARKYAQTVLIEMEPRHAHGTSHDRRRMKNACVQICTLKTHAQTYVHDPTCIVCTYLCMLGGRHIQTYICMHECMRVCLQICSCIPRHMRWWSKLAIRVIRHAVHAYISIFGFCSYRAIRENLLPLHALSKVSRTTMKLPQP